MHTDGGDKTLKSAISQLSDLRNLDLGSGHMAYHCVSLIDHNLWSELWSDGRTPRPALFGWLRVVNLKIPQ